MSDAAWLHTIDPFAIRFSQNLGVRWYGVAYLAGFVVGWWILRSLAKRRLVQLSPQQVGDAMLTLVLGVFVGGRLGYVLLYEPTLFVTFSSSPPWWGLLALNRGGMASHGGMIGVIIASFWIARRTKTSSLHILDMVVLATPVGMFFGRVANFINGELLGRIVAMPGESAPWWSVRFPQELLTGYAPLLSTDQATKLTALLDRAAPGWSDAGGVGYRQAVERLIDVVQSGVDGFARELAPLLSARHPSQLYQALAEGPILLATLWFIWRKPRRPGVVGSWFLIVYGALRITTEHWRLPDDNLAVKTILGLSRGQWLSAMMALAGVVALTLILTRGKQQPVGGWRRGKKSKNKSGSENDSDSAAKTEG